MSHDWSQSSMKSESLIHPEDTHWNSGDWSNDQITAIGTHQAYLDPRQLHSGQGQPSQAFNLDTSSLTHGAASPHEFNNALPTSQYASPLHSRTELTSSRSGYHRHQGSRQSTPYDYDSGRDMASLDTDADEEDAEPNEPYNKLLHRCLLQQPNLELLLKDIYEWFRLNTDKGRDPRQKGWQNSIRHNLSMNPAFHKGSRSQPGATITNMWSLTDKAILHGVEPTTRFRNHNRPAQRARALRAAVPQRQVSGARGGRAARRSARLRHVTSPGNTRSPSPALDSYTTPHTPGYGYMNAQHMDGMSDWQAYNRNSAPYYFNAVNSNDKHTSMAAFGTDFLSANQFQACNTSAYTPQMLNDGTFQQRQSSALPQSYTQQFEVPSNDVLSMGRYSLPQDEQSLPQNRCETLPPTSSNTPSLVDYNISGMHADAKGEPLFSGSGDEDSSVELDMPKTPQLGESIGWNDEAAGMFFNFDDK